MTADELRLVRLDERDADALLSVSESAKWNHTRQDWDTMLGAGIVHGHRMPTGELASCAAVFALGPALAFIGMVIVRPDHRGRGLARELMQTSLTCLPDPAPPFALIATADGLPLYEKLGFETVDRVQGFIRRAARGHDARGPDSRRKLAPIGPGDIDALARLDAIATGGDRSRLLAARARQGGVLLRSGDGVAGFGLMTRQRELAVVGPVIATDAAAAIAITTHLVETHDGDVRIDIPAEQTEVAASLVGRGFECRNQAPVMVLGAAALPGRRDRIFALASRAFG